MYEDIYRCANVTGVEGKRGKHLVSQKVVDKEGLEGETERRKEHGGVRSVECGELERGARRQEQHGRSW